MSVLPVTLLVLSPMWNNTALWAELITLRSDVLSWVASSNEADSLVLICCPTAEIVWVQYTTLEILNTRELRHVRSWKVPVRHDHIIEELRVLSTRLIVLNTHTEVACLSNPLDVGHCGWESDYTFVELWVFEIAEKVVSDRRTGWIRAHILAEMLFVRVIRQLMNFFGAIGPKVRVHAIMQWFPILVHSSPPCVVPHASDDTLLLKAHDFGDRLPLLFQVLECTDLEETWWPTPNDSPSVLVIKS